MATPDRYGHMLFRLLEFTGDLTIPRLQAAPVPAPGAELVEAVSRTVVLVAGVLAVAILIPLVLLVYRRLFSSMGSPAPEAPDPEADIDRYERRGDFISAASVCEREKQYGRAADLFEKARDFARAAEMHEAAGNLPQAVELHLRSGGALRAAAIHVRTGNYLEAAKIFRNKGDHLRAGKAFEQYGNKAAAAREFGEAGQHEKAAWLLKEEGLYEQAAEAYRPLLGEGGLKEDSVDAYYNYAAILALAGRREEAIGIYRSILGMKGGYRKVLENLRALGVSEPAPDAGVNPAPPPAASEDVRGAKERTSPGQAGSGTGGEGSGDGLRRYSTLRDIIVYGHLEPRYSMKLWAQILKALSAHHRGQTFFGCLTPDDIRIDMENRVEISPPESRPAVYTAPEVLAGQAPGPHSDMYSMGVILFEMVTGSLDHIGERRPAEIRADLPSWLDDLIIRCTKKDRRDRYLNSEEIFSDLRRLRDAPQGQQ